MNLRDEIDKLLAKLITRETHSGSVNRVRHLAREELLQLFDKSVERAKIEELESWLPSVQESGAQGLVNMINERIRVLKNDRD